MSHWHHDRLSGQNCICMSRSFHGFSALIICTMSVPRHIVQYCKVSTACSIGNEHRKCHTLQSEPEPTQPWLCRLVSCAPSHVASSVLSPLLPPPSSSASTSVVHPLPSPAPPDCPQPPACRILDRSSPRVDAIKLIMSRSRLSSPEPLRTGVDPTIDRSLLFLDSLLLYTD
jgi:hypothetical protein